jgi:hypothetical protein
MCAVAKQTIPNDMFPHFHASQVAFMSVTHFSANEFVIDSACFKPLVQQILTCIR